MPQDAELRAMAEAAFGALNSGDLDSFLALASHDVEFTPLVAEVEGTTFRGHAGVRTWWETVRGASRTCAGSCSKSVAAAVAASLRST